MSWDIDQRNRFGKLLITTAKLYGNTIDYDVTRLIIDDLQDLNFEMCCVAMERFRLNAKNKTWPRAAEIRAIVNPTVSPEAKANEAASRIRSAIGTYGWSQPAEARLYIGELGWKIVERSGGWSYLCENHGVELSPLTFHAQARDLGKAMLESASLGEFDKPIGIPAPSKNIAGLQKADVLSIIQPKPKDEK